MQTHVIDDNCLVSHDHDPHSGQKYILMINQAIQIYGQENHLLYSIQCHLNGVHNSEIPKFLADSPSVTTDAIPLIDPPMLPTLS